MAELAIRWQHTCAGTLQQAAAAPPARATVQVLPPGASDPVEAYALDVGLRAVALRGAVSSKAAMDFKRVLRRHARFKLEQRAQLADLYAELSATR